MSGCEYGGNFVLTALYHEDGEETEVAAAARAAVSAKRTRRHLGDHCAVETLSARISEVSVMGWWLHFGSLSIGVFYDCIEHYCLCLHCAA